MSEEILSFDAIEKLEFGSCGCCTVTFPASIAPRLIVVAEVKSFEGYCTVQSCDTEEPPVSVTPKLQILIHACWTITVEKEY